MNGSVVKKGNCWYVIIEGDSETGKRKRDWHSGFRTKREAEDARIDLLSRKQRGTYVAPSGETLKEFLAEWLPAKTPTIRSSTRDSYERIIDGYINPQIGEVRLREIKPQRLNKLYGDLLAAGGKRGKSLSPKTVRNVHVILRKAFSDAIRWGRLAINPADNADPPKLRDHGRREMKTWAAGELGSFLKTLDADQHPLHALYLVAATTGMRRGEVLGLRWKDLDLEARTVAINQTVISIAYEVQFSTPKTKSGHRAISLDSTTVRALRQQRKRQAATRLAVGSAWVSHDLVFTRHDGEPLHPDFVSQSFERLVKSMGLPRIRLHDLRHTHASLALAAGIHPKVVSERLGHSTVSITLDTYSHVIPSLQSEVAEVVAAMVFSEGR